MMATWKPIPGYEGLYEASDEGQIRSLDKLVDYGQAGVRNLSGRVLKPRVSSSGHMGVTLYRDGVASQLGLHRLILETFVGPCPVSMEGCHKDGNPANNEISNLRWDTYSANAMDRVGHGTSNRGAKNGGAKLDAIQVAKIRELCAERKIFQKDIAVMFGVSKQLVSMIRRGDVWQ